MKCPKVVAAIAAAAFSLLLVGSVVEAQTTSSTPTLSKRLIADYGYWSQTQNASLQFCADPV